METRYAQLDKHICGGRSADYRKLENNTWAERRDNGAIAVRLHNTDVLTFTTDGAVVLNTGGWRTVTTCDRINSYLPAGWRVFRTNHTLFLADIRNGWQNAPRFEFEDGMIITADGVVLTSAGEPATGYTDEERKAHNRMLRRVSRYVDEFMAEFAVGNVRREVGECLLCKIAADGQTSDGQPAAREFGADSSHWEGHIEEKYYNAAALIAAIKVYPVGQIYREWIMALAYADQYPGMAQEYAFVGERMGAIEQVGHSLRRYILMQMGYAA